MCRCLPFQRTTRDNLRRAFPKISQSRLREIETTYYQRACEFAAEMVYSFLHREADLLQIHFTNLECLEDAFRQTDFVVCYSGHFLNYEALTRLPRLLKGVDMYCYYHPTGLKSMDDFVGKVRSRYGAKFIPTTSPLKTLLALKQKTTPGVQKYLIGSLADLNPMGKAAHSSPFFEGRVSAYCGTERVGRKLNAAFFYAKMLRTGRGCYEVELSPLVPDENSVGDNPVTDLFFRNLEENIKLQPELWMLWATPRFEFGVVKR